MGVSGSGSIGYLKQNDHISKAAAINIISNFGSHSLGSSEKDIQLSENEAQLGACPLQDEIGYGYKENQGHGEENIHIMKKTGESDENCEQSSVKETLLKYSNHTADVVLQHIQSHGTSESGEKCKIVTRKVTPTDKLWDGCLQLNSSVTVSAVAFFKSGEKMPGAKWSKSVEVKGKVKLEAFEKYVQDLPRSRNRGLMVVSLRWKEGSSKTGLAGMKKVAKGYKEGDRVGFAQVSPGIDLYVCPRSETIITILAKHGFFKGKTAIEENKDSLIGCVVWRRNQINRNSVEQKPERCAHQVAVSNVSPSHLPAESFLEPSRRNYVAPYATPKDRIERDKCKSKSPLGLHSFSTRCNPMATQSNPSISPSVPAGPITPYSDPAYQQVSVGRSSKLQSLKEKSGEEQQDLSLELQMPVFFPPPDVTKQPSPILDSEDLPEFDFGTSCGTISQAVTNNELDSLTVDRKLPEKGFRNMNGSPRLMVSTLKSMPTSHHRRLESINRHDRTSEDTQEMPPQKKVCGLDSSMLPFVAGRQNTALRMPCSTLVGQPVKNLFDDDDDMPEWCPPDVNLKKQSVPFTYQSPNIHIHSEGPISVQPVISAAAPNPFPFSACVAGKHPPFSTQASPFAFHCPVFAPKAQPRPTNLYMAKDPSYPPFRPDSCLVNGKLPSSDGVCKGWMP